MALWRLVPAGETRAADCRARLLLQAAETAFKAMIRTSEATNTISDKNIITYSKIASELGP